MGKFVYSFNEGSKDMRGLLGGKRSQPGGDDQDRIACSLRLYRYY